MYDFMPGWTKPLMRPCDEILPGLFVGGEDAAVIHQLDQRNITHLLTCGVELRLPCQRAPACVRAQKHLSVDDALEEDLLPYFDECVDFIVAGLSERHTGSAVLVHCAQGRSRSVTILVAYLMREHRMRCTDALALVRRKRPVASPNASFWAQLVAYDEKLFGTL